MPRDRTGELLDADPADAFHSGQDCGGWLDRDADHPRPCPICKPWLTERRPPTADELRAARAHQGGHQ